jgi:hypothetical protein
MALVGPSGGYLRFLLLPALERAIAIACLFGRPSFTSLLIFFEMAFWDLPLDRGMITHP